MFIYRCSVVYGTPTMFVDLVQQQKKLHLSIESLCFAFIGGSPLTPQLTKDIMEVLALKQVKVH